MAVVAQVSIGGVDYDVYALTVDPVTDATEYLGGSLRGAAWTAASTDDKKRALVEAARMLDRVVTWSGTKTSDAQPLDWPRDGATCDGEAIADGTIPDEVAFAEFELANLLLADTSIATGSGTGSNVRSAKAGSAAVEFFTPTIGDPTRDLRLPQLVHDLVKCLFGGTAGVGTPFVGDDDESEFDGCSFEVNGGWS